MKARLISPIATLPSFKAGDLVTILDNSMYPETPLGIQSPDGFEMISIEQYAAHFEAYFGPFASDFVFNYLEGDSENMDAHFELLATMLNGILEEHGVFACYTAVDCLLEYNNRL